MPARRRLHHARSEDQPRARDHRRDRARCARSARWCTSASRIATAEGRLEDAAGKLYAHATTTCIVLQAAASDSALPGELARVVPREARAMADRHQRGAAAAAPSAAGRARPASSSGSDAVASSRNSQSGLLSSARAKARRCCSPPESTCAQFSLRSRSPASCAQADGARALSRPRHRRSFAASSGIAHRVLERADRQIGLLRQEQQARALRQR